MDPDIGGDKNSWCLIDNFSIYKKPNSLNEVKLDQFGLHVTPLPKDRSRQTSQFIKSEDLVGCICMKEKINDSLSNQNLSRKSVVFISIYYYHLNAKKKKRLRKQCIFQICHENSFEGNLKIGNKWRSAILFSIHGGHSSKSLFLDGTVASYKGICNIFYFRFCLAVLCGESWILYWFEIYLNKSICFVGFINWFCIILAIYFFMIF